MAARLALAEDLPGSVENVSMKFGWYRRMAALLVAEVSRGALRALQGVRSFRKTSHTAAHPLEVVLLVAFFGAIVSVVGCRGRDCRRRCSNEGICRVRSCKKQWVRKCGCCRHFGCASARAKTFNLHERGSLYSPLFAESIKT